MSLWPSPFFTTHHRDHHTLRLYGTPQDPEYVVNVCQRGNYRQLFCYLLVVAIFPLIVFARFLLAPVSRRASRSIFVYIAAMSTAPESQPVSVEAYLDGELRAKHKHEYVNGVVYQMAGANNAHNRIATNGIGLLHAQLRGQPCQVFNADTKVRVKRGQGTRFYYPDCLVACNLNPSHDTFQDQPVVIIEVISESTRRTDEQEKREAYLSLPSLQVYVLVEQSSFAAVVYRRVEGEFTREVYSGLPTIIPLPEIQCQLPLAELYENVVLTAVVKEDDEWFSLQA